jgi:hypothetical protein
MKTTQLGDDVLRSITEINLDQPVALTSAILIITRLSNFSSSVSQRHRSTLNPKPNLYPSSRFRNPVHPLFVKPIREGGAMKHRQRNSLFETALEIGKFTLLAIFSGTLLSIISVTFGFIAIAQFFTLLFTTIIWRVIIIILCIVAAGIVAESCR